MATALKTESSKSIGIGIDDLGAIGEEAEVRYRELVVDLADEKKLDPMRIREVLAMGGRSLDELKGHVEKLGRRRAALADLKAADAMASKVERAEAEAAASSKSLRELQQRLKEELEAAQAEHAKLSFAAKRAKDDLNQKCLEAGEAIEATEDRTIEKGLARLRQIVTEREGDIQTIVFAFRGAESQRQAFEKSNPQRPQSKFVEPIAPRDRAKMEHQLTMLRAEVAEYKSQIERMEADKADPVRGMAW